MNMKQAEQGGHRTDRYVKNLDIPSAIQLDDENHVTMHIDHGVGLQIDLRKIKIILIMELQKNI